MGRKAIDLTGQKFGYLTVIEKANDRIISGKIFKYWLCKCDCGNVKEVSTQQLLTGITKSCGCKKVQIKNDLTGQKFGHLIVLKRDGYTKTTNGRKHVTWLCKCDCGNEIRVRGELLKNNNTTSCGCAKNKTKNDLKGKRFGKLVAIKQTDKRKRGSTIWLCKCDCGNYKEVSRIQLLNGSTTSCGCIRSKIYNYKDFDGTATEICRKFHKVIRTVNQRLNENYTIDEAMEIPLSKIRVNLKRKYKNFTGNLIEICNHFNKNFDDVYSYLLNVYTLEYAMEHARDNVDSEKTH